jgi:hypothetical protein
MKPKKELTNWQKRLIKDYGIFVITCEAGQVRRYRETIYLFEVVDIYDQYSKNEILELCIIHVQQAELPVSPNLQLFMTVLEFTQLSPHCYLYKCG